MGRGGWCEEKLTDHWHTPQHPLYPLRIFVLNLISNSNIKSHTDQRRRSESIVVVCGSGRSHCRTPQLCRIQQNSDPLCMHHDGSNDPTSSEVRPLEGLPEAPVGWSNIVRHRCSSIAGDSLEGDGLAVHSAVPSELPHLSPVTLQGEPVSAGALDVQLLHITSPSHIGDENQKEVRVAVDGEPHASRFRARHSAIQSNKQRQKWPLSHQKTLLLWSPNDLKTRLQS